MRGSLEGEQLCQGAEGDQPVEEERGPEVDDETRANPKVWIRALGHAHHRSQTERPGSSQKSDTMPPRLPRRARA